MSVKETEQPMDLLTRAIRRQIILGTKVSVPSISSLFAAVQTGIRSAFALDGNRRKVSNARAAVPLDFHVLVLPI